MAANGELVQEGGGREEGEEGMDMDDEASFLSLEFALTGEHEDEEKDNPEDGKLIYGRQLVAVEASRRGDAASEALGKVGRQVDLRSSACGRHGSFSPRGCSVGGLREAVGPAAILRTLVRKLRLWKAAGPVYPSASRGRAVAALEDGDGRFKGKGEVQPEAARRPGAGAVTSVSEERWTPATAEAALKYLSKMPVLSCRRGMGDGPHDISPAAAAHNLPEAKTTVLPVPARRSRGETGLPVPARRSRGETGLRQACKRLGISRSSVAASPPPMPQHRDDSLLQAQDGIASAIAYCKLSLTTSKGFELPKVTFSG